MFDLEIFSTLRVLVDEPKAWRRFLALGSASPGLLRQSSETLAGRIAYHELGGFGLLHALLGLPIAGGSQAAPLNMIRVGAKASSGRPSRASAEGVASSPGEACS